MAWRGVNRAILDLIALPWPKSWWKTRKHWYTDNFQFLIDDIITMGDGKGVFSEYDLERLDQPRYPIRGRLANVST